MYVLSTSSFLLYSLVRITTNKEAKNTFLLLEIIYNLSLILSLYITLLSLIFANNVFLTLNLISAKKISKLDI
jgi:hypothetical protein